MKLLFALSFITSIAFGQNDIQAIHNIKKQFQEISELQEKGKLIEKEIQYNCEDFSISGSITFHYQNQDLRLISHSFDQGHYSVFQDYYILDDMLFFYFQTESYDNDQSIRDENTGALLDTKEDWSTSHLRVYFNKGKTLKCLVKQYENEDVTDEIKEKYPEISDYFNNEKIDCDYTKTNEILSTCYKLIEYQNLNIENICTLHE